MIINSITGYCYQLNIYRGKDTKKNEYRYGGNIVLMFVKLSQIKIFFDQLFRSISTLSALPKMNKKAPRIIDAN